MLIYHDVCVRCGKTKKFDTVPVCPKCERETRKLHKGKVYWEEKEK